MIIDSAKYSCAAGHDINEDSFLCSPDKGVFVVADGLGGHSSGERASLAAVDYFEENCRGGYTNGSLLQLLEGANTDVLQNGEGGKSTVAAVLAEEKSFFYANAGDSRVYFFRGGKIIAQTKDNSVCQAAVDMGIIRPEDIRGNEDRSRLVKVLGSVESLNIKNTYPPIELQNGDAFLVCSDGFWEYVYEAEMEADLLKSNDAETWLKYMLKRHILRAKNKGDNYTAICGIVYLDGSEKPFTAALAEPESVEVTVSQKKEINKKTAVAAIVAAAAVLIAAAVGLAYFIRSRHSRKPDNHDDTAPMTEDAVLTQPPKSEAILSSDTATEPEETKDEDSESKAEESTATEPEESAENTLNSSENEQNTPTNEDDGG